MSGKSLLEFSSVSKHYSGQELSLPVLDQVSFSIDKGQSLAITGPSGSGKTTLLNLAGLLDTPSSGQILIDGTETSRLKQDEMAQVRNQKIGFVFQLHYLLPQLTLLENVLLPVLPIRDKSFRTEARLRGMELLDEVGLSEKLNRLPGQLSVGECQRGALVRALINKPALVLADEPTGSLDHDTGEKVASLLIDLCKNHEAGLIVVTHAASLAQKMQKSFSLFSGKLHSQQA